MAKVELRHYYTKILRGSKISTTKTLNILYHTTSSCQWGHRQRRVRLGLCPHHSRQAKPSNKPIHLIISFHPPRFRVSTNRRGRPPMRLFDDSISLWDTSWSDDGIFAVIFLWFLPYSLTLKILAWRRWWGHKPKMSSSMILYLCIFIF